MEPLPPFLFAAQNQRERRRLAHLKGEGRIRQIGPRLYTSLPDADVPAAARGAWTTIASGLFPGALVSHRTALEYLPSPEGVVFLTAKTNRKLSYPGLTIEFVRGPDPLPDDQPFVGLRASSLPRALLENLKRDPRSASQRTVPIADLESRLEQILRDGGEEELNRIRDRAREIARELDWNPEFDRLDGAIGALLGTRPADRVTSSAARARALGEPFDTACLERLQLLAGELRTRALATLPESSHSPQHVRNKAFVEAYFSNYIEGTAFEIEEAEEIVFDGKIPAARPVDAHDIIGTFDVVSDPNEMRRTPSSSGELLELLRARHHTMLARRPEVQPGTFKQRVNRARDTVFVIPEYVIGTLRKGHELYADLDRGFPRAVFLTFLVSDVHPFTDGNGRIARVMMNAELVAAGASTIIIPTVYRDDYLLALRALTRRNRPKPLVDALAKAAAFSRLDFSIYPRALEELQRRNWFQEPDEARILLPD
jgi:hypothetical protein